MSGENIIFLLFVLGAWLLPTLLKAKAKRERQQADRLQNIKKPPSPETQKTAPVRDFSDLFRQMLGEPEEHYRPPPQEKPPPKSKPAPTPKPPPPPVASRPTQPLPKSGGGWERLHFSDNPLLQGIIISEILSPPPSWKTRSRNNF